MCRPVRLPAGDPDTLGRLLADRGYLSAAHAMGIDRKTLYRWRRLGNQRLQPYAAWWDRVRAVRDAAIDLRLADARGRAFCHLPPCPAGVPCPQWCHL